MPAKKRSRRARRADKGKQRRPSVRVAPRRVGEPPPRRVEGVRAAPGPQTRAMKAAADFRERYTYVHSDLRRIGALAGAIFFALVILSLILR